MSQRDLQSIFLSGELTALNLGGTTPDEEVLTRSAIRDILVPLGVTTWAGEWLSNQTYRKDAIVLDGGYLMAANKETQQRPAPQRVGDELPSYATAPDFLDASHVGVVHSGQVYEFTTTGWLTAILVYVPVVDPDVSYRVLMADITDPDAPIYLTIPNPIVTEDGWHIVGVGNRIVAVGTRIEIILEAVNSSATTDITGAWTYDGTSQNGGPAVSSWNTNNALTAVRLSKSDLLSADRTADLLSITVGSELTFAMTSSPATNFANFTVTGNPTDEGDYIEYVVSPGAAAGTIPEGQSCDFTGAIPVAAATLYSEEVDYWIGNAQPSFCSAEGVLLFDGVTQAGVENNAYSVAVAFQEALVSEDWDLMAYSTPGGSGESTHAYRYSKVAAVTIVDTEPAYTPIDSLSAELPAGTYELKFTFTWTLDSTTTSAFYRWRPNGAAWNVIQAEPKDVTDSRIVTYFFPYEHSGGTLLLESEGAKENGGDVMEILYHDLIIDGK